MSANQSSRSGGARPHGSRVERQFRRKVDLRGIELPDWDFITRTSELLRRYADAENEESFSLRGSDSRGSYSALTLDAFRTEQSERGVDLGGIQIRVHGRDKHGFFMHSVECTRSGWGSAEFLGGDEVVVNGIAARVEQLAGAAKACLKAKEQAAAREEAERQAQEAAAQTASSVASTRGRPPPTRWWNHPWTVTIVGGTIAAIIAGLVLLIVVAH
jgi:hypothetical protein